MVCQQDFIIYYLMFAFTLFQKVICDICVVCGVVYYTSPLWWQESARDHGDALLSFKHPPTVYISAIARISPYAILSLLDLKTILPPHLLNATNSKAKPWLTDNVSILCFKDY